MTNTKNNFSGRILTVGSLFILASIALAISPIRMFAVIPGVIGVIIGIIGFVYNREKYNKKHKGFLALIIISIACTLGALLAEVAIKKEVAKDEQFQNKIEKSQQDAGNDLDSALKDIK